MKSYDTADFKTARCVHCERTDIARLIGCPIFNGCPSAHVRDDGEPCYEGNSSDKGATAITNADDREENLERLLAEVETW